MAGAKGDWAERNAVQYLAAVITVAAVLCALVIFALPGYIIVGPCSGAGCANALLGNSTNKCVVLYYSQNGTTTSSRMQRVSDYIAGLDFGRCSFRYDRVSNLLMAQCPGSLNVYGNQTERNYSVADCNIT